MQTTVEALGFKQQSINTRANEMWRAISRSVDFRKKNVVDFGCGYGDFLWRSFIAGANFVVGVDVEQKFETYCQKISFVKQDVNTVDIHCDIAICFSVITYLKRPRSLLNKLSKYDTCLLEFQYFPEPYNIGISNDDEARKELFVFWNGVDKIGESYVKERDIFRTIWKLTNDNI